MPFWRGKDDPFQSGWESQAHRGNGANRPKTLAGGEALVIILSCVLASSLACGIAALGHTLGWVALSPEIVQLGFWRSWLIISLCNVGSSGMYVLLKRRFLEPRTSHRRMHDDGY